MDNSFSSQLTSANSVLILLPNKPYFDQVAAALALYLSLKETKNTTISCPSPMMVEFNRLVGVDKITSELGNKNLTIKFKSYPAENIERVSADVDGSEFKLTVIPKTGLPSPQKEQVDLSLSGIAADLVILIGGANESHFPAISNGDLGGAKIIHIGTRQLATVGEKGIASFAMPLSSVSEIVALLLKENGLAMDGDIATNLIAGIEDGSNHFMGDDVTADSFEVFANLLRSGGVRISKEGFVKKQYPQGSIPGQPVHNVPPISDAEKIEKKEQPQATPKDWFEPKIYKGTSVS